MNKVDKITKTLQQERNRLVLRESKNKPQKKLIPFKRFIGKFKRQRIQIGEATYYLSCFDENEPGEFRVASVELTNEMGLDARIAAITEFAATILELPADIVCFAVWKERPGVPDEL